MRLDDLTNIPMSHSELLDMIRRASPMDAEAFAEIDFQARRVLRAAPNDPQAHNLMGMAFQVPGLKPHAAAHHYSRVIDLSGWRQPGVLANLATCRMGEGRIDEARELYEEALAAAPDNIHALLGLAKLHEADRNLEGAQALLDRVDAIAPGHPGARQLRATVLGRLGKIDAALALMDIDALSVPVMLEQGRLFDQTGQYIEAFAAWTKAKEGLLDTTGLSYRDTDAAALAKGLMQFFTASTMATLPRADVRMDCPQPLFIVGFPRSGTTLMEQMLTKHPQIAPGGELPLIADLADRLPQKFDSELSYPDCLSELWMGDHQDDLNDFRDYYLRGAKSLGAGRDGARWFTDKMPFNEAHLGLITLTFPDAPIVQMVRHPLDVVLSTFGNMLHHGFGCAYSLESAAQHYVLMAELMETMLEQCVPKRFISVRYEDLVDDPEDILRDVLAVTGEAFDPLCLEFHNNSRYARTASYAQVSQRLYTKSRFRYQHYLKQLAPIIPMLEPVIERLGYQV